MGKLQQKRLDALTKTKGRYGDGDGLYFRSHGGGKAYFIYRYMLRGVGREMSLGPHPEVSLADARAKHAALRKQVIADKVDPQSERAKHGKSASRVPTFGQCADQYIASHEASWKNPKHRDQWHMTLGKHAAPIRNLPIDKVDAKGVLRVLSPIWTATPETASRLRGRIEAVWASAQVAGHIDPDRPNPARWKGWLQQMLPNPKKLGERGNHASMPWADVPLFFAKLKDAPGSVAKALAFTILAAARTSEIIGMTFDEIGDLDSDRPTWTVPAARMKMSKPHDVPLSAPAVAILREMIAQRTASRSGAHPFVFPSTLPRKPLSNMAMAMLMRRLGAVEFTVHGFRSSARSWMADHGVAFEVAESVLAHSSSGIVAAYQRSSLVERRRPVMERWSAFCAGEETTGEVVPLRKVAVE
jgi:integrase